MRLRPWPLSGVAPLGKTHHRGTLSHGEASIHPERCCGHPKRS
jgi:hypothetical protein